VPSLPPPLPPDPLLLAGIIIELIPKLEEEKGVRGRGRGERRGSDKATKNEGMA